MAKDLKADYEVILIPDHVVTEKTTKVVIYLKEIISPSVSNVVVELTHKTTKKIEFLPATKLGNDALLIQLPAINLAGEMDGVIKLDGHNTPKYPNFVISVLTPLDTLFHNSIENARQSSSMRVCKVRNCSALLSATLAYLVTLSPHKITKEVHADPALQRLMAMVHKKKNKKLPLLVQDLCSGKNRKGETILHFSLRNCLSGVTYSLIDKNNTPVNLIKLLASLDQESYDFLTPRFLAGQFDTDILSRLEASYENEIGFNLSEASPPISPAPKRKLTIDRKVSELITRVKKRTSRQHSPQMVQKRKSALLDVQNDRFGSCPDFAGLNYGFGIPASPTTPNFSLRSQSRSQSLRPVSPEDDDLVVSYDEASNTSIIVEQKPRSRKKSISVDTGLNTMMMGRPLPKIPSKESDEEYSGEESLVEDVVYQVPPRTSLLAHPAEQGKFDARHSFVSEDPLYDIPSRVRRTIVPRWLSGSFIVRQNAHRKESGYEPSTSDNLTNGTDHEEDVPNEYEVPQASVQSSSTLDS